MYGIRMCPSDAYGMCPNASRLCSTYANDDATTIMYTTTRMLPYATTHWMYGSRTLYASTSGWMSTDATGLSSVPRASSNAVLSLL